MLNKFPIIGWALSLLLSMSVSVPFWFFWTYVGLGRQYFYFLPPVYWHVPFWNCVGLFVILSIIKGLIPTFISTSSSGGSGGNVNTASERNITLGRR